MKTTGQGRLRIAACIVLTVVLSLLPLAWFYASDQLMLAQVTEVDDPYASRRADIDDFYLLKLLRRRSEAWSSDWRDGTPLSAAAKNVYTEAGYDRITMVWNTELGSLIATILHELREANALTWDWYNAVLSSMGDTDLLSYNAQTYSASDSLGITRILLYPPDAPEVSNGYDSAVPLLAMDYDSTTGKVLRLWIQVPAEQFNGQTFVKPQTALNGWLSWLELDTLGDWEAPANSIYEQNSLYSARGQALLSCATCSYETDGTLYFCYGMQLDDQGTTPAGTAGDTSLLPAGNGMTALGNAGDVEGFYETIWVGDAIIPDTENGEVMFYTDFETPEQNPFCTLPDCTHRSRDCPAWMEDGSGSWFVQDGRVYYLVGSGVCSVELSDVTDDELVTLYRYYMSGGYTMLDSYTQEELDAARAWGEENIYLPKLMVMDGTQRTAVGTLPYDMMRILGHDDRWMYGVLWDGARWNWLRMDLTTGESTTAPLPETSSFSTRFLGIRGTRLAYLDAVGVLPNRSNERELCSGQLTGKYSSRRYRAYAYDFSDGTLTELAQFDEPLIAIGAADAGTIVTAALYEDTIFVEMTNGASEATIYSVNLNTGGILADDALNELLYMDNGVDWTFTSLLFDRVDGDQWTYASDPNDETAAYFTNLRTRSLLTCYLPQDYPKATLRAIVLLEDGRYFAELYLPEIYTASWEDFYNYTQYVGSYDPASGVLDLTNAEPVWSWRSWW